MLSKKQIAGLVLGVFTLTLAGKAPVFAGDVPQCASIPTTTLVDVTQTVVNDSDSGNNGYWATDNYQRHIRVWRNEAVDSGSAYCARVDYDGTFDAWSGAKSPQAGIVFTNGIHGTMSGGRTATIRGTFRGVNSAWKTSGDVGSFDYMCDKQGSCPGIVRWQGQYFAPEYQYADTDWAWTYKSCGHGQWVNALSGNSGDIVNGPTDEVCPTPTPAPTATPDPKSGKQSSAGIDGKVCSGQNFNAYAVLKLDGNPVKDVSVKFVYNGEAKFAKTQVDGRAGVAYGYANDSDVQYLPEDGYPTQLQKAVKANDCAVIVTAGTTTTGGQVLGATTLAKTGSFQEITMNLIGFAGAGLTAAGSFLTLKKKI